MPVISRLAAATARAWGFFAQLAGGTVGKLFTWGLNDYGQLGQNNVQIQQSFLGSPIQLGSGSNTVSPSNRTLSNGSGFTTFIKPNGTLWVSGGNGFGKLGQNNTVNYSSPVQVGSANTWRQVSAGANTVLAIKSDNTLWGWGRGGTGLLAQNDTIDRSSPIQITGSWSWISYASQYAYAMGVKTDGTLWTWGSQSYNGSSGLNIENTAYSSPVQVGSDTNWLRVWAGNNTTSIGIKTDGTLWTWGEGNIGQSGHNKTINYSSPVQLGSDTNWYWAAQEAQATLLMKTDGRIYSMGNNDHGQLGQNNLINLSNPTQIGTQTYLSISSNNNGFIAVDKNGNAWTWGSSAPYSGTDNATVRSSPIQIGHNGGPYIFAAGNTSGGRVTLIESTGKLYFWGDSSYGGYGSNGRITDSYSRPIQVGNWGLATYWAPNEGGSFFQSQLRYDGVLFGEGTNAYGQLGDNSDADKSSPVQIGSAPFATVANGWNMSYGIKNDGTLWSWGYNGTGSLGTNDTVFYSSPVQVGALNTWQKTAGGYLFGAALRIDRLLYTWGQNSYGQLGIENTSNRSSPVQIAGEFNNMACGQYHMVALKVSGANAKVWAWGANDNGQLNQNNTVNYSSPVQVANGDCIKISAGQSHTAFILDDNTLWTVGANNAGQLGNNSTVSKSSAVQIGGTDWADVCCIGEFTLASKTDGSIWAWGSNGSGQLGQGASNETNYSSPVQITGTTWGAITSGTYNSLANRTDGTLWTWGAASSGQLGNNANYVAIGTQVSSPVQVGSDTTWTSFSASLYNVAAINAGSLYTWGWCEYGSLGTGVSSAYRSSPVQVGALTTWSSVAAGNFYALATKTDGTLWAWGYNGSGQLGTNSLVDRSSPIQIGSATDWTYISAGSATVFGLRGTSAYGWGNNDNGQFSTGGTERRSSPVQISGTWSSIQSGASYFLGIRSNGALWGCGRNLYGQLGTNDTVDRSNQVQIGSDTNWAYVSAYSNVSAAIKTNGTLWTWGFNQNGALGDNTTVNKSSPIQIGSDTNWSKVYVLTSQVIAIKTDGSIWSWGQNDVGQLGQNDVVYRSSPVQIGNLTKWAGSGIFSGKTASGIQRV